MSTSNTPQAAHAGPTKAINLDVLEAMAGMHGEARHATLIELGAVDALLLNAGVGELRQIGGALASMAAALQPTAAPSAATGTAVASCHGAPPSFVAAGIALANAIALSFKEFQDQLGTLHARFGYYDERVCVLEEKAAGFECKTDEMKTAQETMAGLLEHQHRHIVAMQETVGSLDCATGELKTAQAETATQVGQQAGKIATLGAGVRFLETGVAALRAAQNDVTGCFDRLREHVEEQDKAIEKATAFCERLERFQIGTVQQLILLYRTVDALACEIKGWETTVAGLQSHVDEFDIDVTILEVVDEPAPRGGGKKSGPKNYKRSR